MRITGRSNNNWTKLRTNSTSIADIGSILPVLLLLVLLLLMMFLLVVIVMVLFLVVVMVTVLEVGDTIDI